jgi:hypothetical protein
VVALGCSSSSSPVKATLPGLTSTTTIGTTIDPAEHGGNPYGLVIAPATEGLITKGDLVICNFNDGATGTEGEGTTLVGLHPTPSATPYRIARDASLAGCNALAMLPDDSVSVSAYTTNKNPVVSATGSITTPFETDAFYGPWGEAYVPAANGRPAALYVSNSNPGHGTIDRLTLSGEDGQASFTEIATGFCAAGSPGAIYAPSGLTYDAALDTLYVVDTSSNSVIALADVSAIDADGVVAAGQCAQIQPTPVPTFSGPQASKARVIASGGMFNAPISAALLDNGNLIVGNGDLSSTSTPPNLMFEISPTEGIVATKQVDEGNPGALFGIVATVDSHGDQLVYFNDDNQNTVMLLSR